jgi:uncharacterized protein
MQQDGEPSVEEILESIKKVIARDNRDSAAQARLRRETAGIARQAPRQPLDEEAEDLDEILELGEAGSLVDDEHVGADYGQAESDGLTNEGAATAMRDSLAALAMIAEPGKPPQIVRSGETSLEGLTRELLRPMLAQWLDQHLPEMVERLVKKEIARIAGKKG